MNVFIHASTEKRANRIVAIYGDDAKNPEKRLKEMDKKRRVYCRNFTGQEWGETHNYQLCIDSGFYGIEKSAEIIAETVK
jgi:cytidylate kinase